MVIPFPSRAHATIHQVGGKGLSLLRLSHLGLEVPGGVILSTKFFQPWFYHVAQTPIWQSLGRTGWSPFCGELAAEIDALVLTPNQRETLAQAIGYLETNSGRYAVRSSSPDEDLAGASFAGTYESRLGVRKQDLEEAIHGCFRASLSQRVFVYKEKHGIDVGKPRLAVIIQEQLDSEIAGVAFSINPLNNDFDEAVINAGWGQGETVVSGSITPDHYVVDKISLQLLERTLGSKERSSWLCQDDKLAVKEGFRSEAWTLTDSQARALTEHLICIETHYGHPVDIEWAYARGSLHFLQARPITAYIPLAEGMQTAPGERRRLYLDAGLMEGATMNAPLSRMSLAHMEDLTNSLSRNLPGKTSFFHPEIDESLLVIDGCRIYLNLSNALWISNQKALAAKYENVDVIASRILAHLDVSAYYNKRRPKGLRWWQLKALWHLRKFALAWLKACFLPSRFRRRCDQITRPYEERLQPTGGKASLPEEYEPLLDRFCLSFLQCTLPAVLAYWFAGRFTARALFKWAPQEIRALAQRLDRGLPNELVVEMGMAMYELSQLIDAQAFADVPALSDRIGRREMPEAFLSKWDAFMLRFGCRAPDEMELSNARYLDDPEILLRQMAGMAKLQDPSRDPESVHRRHLEERKQAFLALQSYLKGRWWRRWRLGPLRWAYHLITLFGGTRDTPKQHLVLLGYHLRRYALSQGLRLVKEGHLHEAKDIFGLTVKELLRVDELRQKTNLQRLTKERFRFYRKLQAQVPNFPHVIDSRGRVLRPPAPESRQGELLNGLPISSGIHRGPVRILRRPDASLIQPGDVLVAYVTDPGWTPLFVNAGAILLEVGGPMQHGALVAREYGKPCVVGIEGITSRFPDGQVVEVDGDTGCVRPIHPQPPSSGTDPPATCSHRPVSH